MVQWKSTRKYVKRTAAKAGRFAKKRYFKGKGYSKPKITQMASDINKLKHLLNVEKKTHIVEERLPITMGLIVDSTKTTSTITGEAIYARRDNVNRSGAYVKTNLIGTLPPGYANGQIVGERAKLVSYHMDYRIKAIRGVATGYSWGKQRSKVRLFLVMLPRADQVLTNDIAAENDEEVMLMRFFDQSVFDATYDGTRRNIEYMKDFKVMASKVITFDHDDDTDGTTTATRHDGIYEGRMGGKCDHHIRYNGVNLIKNQMALIAIPDNGGVSGTSADPNHFTLEYSMKLYYVDN